MYHPNKIINYYIFRNNHHNTIKNKDVICPIEAYTSTLFRNITYVEYLQVCT